MTNKNYVDPKATLPGRKYDSEYKPRFCNYCYYWKSRKAGCELDQCYYLLPEEKKEPKNESECDGCPYGKHQPCIGYCIKQLLKEVKEERNGDVDA